MIIQFYRYFHYGTIEKNTNDTLIHILKGISRLVYPLDDVNLITFLVCMLCLAVSVGTACVYSM